MHLPTPEFFNLTTPLPAVAHVEINVPKKLNAFSQPMWLELRTIFQSLSTNPDIRAVVLSGAGPKAFTAGLDLQASVSGDGFNVAGGASEEPADTARKFLRNRAFIAEFQDCISSLEACSKPVICVLHGYSLGLAIDIASATDIRICAKDTRFSVKEVDIGIAADIGTLSRLPKIVGSLSWVKDVVLTARIFGAEEALQQGFVSRVLETKEEAVKAGLELAGKIAEKSPLAVLGTKELVNYSVDRPIAEGLRYTHLWNAGAIISDDITEAVAATMQKRKAKFHKL